MSVKIEEENEEQADSEDIPHIQEHRCLAKFAFCFFFPLGYLAYRSCRKTRLYKEQKEYEKARTNSKCTFLYILGSIVAGSIIFFCIFFRIFYK